MNSFIILGVVLYFAVEIRALGVPLGGVGVPNVGVPNVGVPNVGVPNVGLPNVGNVLNGVNPDLSGVDANTDQDGAAANAGHCESICIKQVANCKARTCAAIIAAGESQDKCLSAYEQLKVKVCKDLCVQVSVSASG